MNDFTNDNEKKSGKTICVFVLNELAEDSECNATGSVVAISKNLEEIRNKMREQFYKNFELMKDNFMEARTKDCLISDTNAYFSYDYENGCFHNYVIEITSMDLEV